MPTNAANTIGYVLVVVILLVAVALIASRFLPGSVIPSNDYFESSSSSFYSSSEDGTGVGTQIDVEGGGIGY